MQFKMLEQGNDGFQHFNPGDTIERPSDWLLRCVVLGAATPSDDEAKALCDKLGLPYKTEES